MTARWVLADAEEPWAVEIEHDRFSEGEPFVVSIWVQEATGDVPSSEARMATPTAEQAREMAAALLRAADAADAANTRRA
jgi:hypothetical protein